MVLKSSHIRQERPLDEVKRVVMEDFGDLTIQNGEKEMLVVEAEGEMLPHVSSTVKDGLLTLALDRSWLEKISNSFTLRDLRYLLTLKSLEALEVNGLARVSILEVKSESFSLRQTGRVHTTIESLQTGSFECVLHWGSRVTVASGSAESQKIVLSHTSKYTADKLATARAEAALSAESHAMIQVSETLSAVVGEGCSLEYVGNPGVTVSGDGTVTRLAAG